MQLSTYKVKTAAQLAILKEQAAIARQLGIADNQAGLPPPRSARHQHWNQRPNTDAGLFTCAAIRHWSKKSHSLMRAENG